MKVRTMIGGPECFVPNVQLRIFAQQLLPLLWGQHKSDSTGAFRPRCLKRYRMTSTSIAAKAEDVVGAVLVSITRLRMYLWVSLSCSWRSRSDFRMEGWWFWMLIPAFSMMGTGVAQFIRLKEREKLERFQWAIWSSLHCKLHPSMPLSPLAKLASLCAAAKRY